MRESDGSLCATHRLFDLREAAYPQTARHLEEAVQRLLVDRYLAAVHKLQQTLHVLSAHTDEDVRATARLQCSGHGGKHRRLLDTPGGTSVFFLLAVTAVNLGK